MADAISNTPPSESEKSDSTAARANILGSVDDPFAVALTTAVLAENATYILGLASDKDREKFNDKYETFWIERALESKPNSLLGVRTALRFISVQFREDAGPRSGWGQGAKLTNHCIEESLYFLEKLEQDGRKAGAS